MSEVDVRKTVDASMTKALITTRWDDHLDSAYSKLNQNKIRHLPVVDDKGKLVGIISRADIPQDFDPRGRVADFMSWPVKTVSRDTALKAATERMIDEKISAFVVTETDAGTGTLVGIITTEDLLRVLATLLGSPGMNRSTGETFTLKIRDLAYNSPIGKIVDMLGNAGV